MLSISVGLLNLLPIPLLDGGHLAYYAIEALLGKAVNERAKQFGIDIGLFLLVAFKANDLLVVSRSQPFVRVRKAIRQAAVPAAAVGIEV